MTTSMHSRDVRYEKAIRDFLRAGMLDWSDIERFAHELSLVEEERESRLIAKIGERLHADALRKEREASIALDEMRKRASQISENMGELFTQALSVADELRRYFANDKGELPSDAQLEDDSLFMILHTEALQRITRALRDLAAIRSNVSLIRDSKTTTDSDACIPKGLS